MLAAPSPSWLMLAILFVAPVLMAALAGAAMQPLHLAASLMAPLVMTIQGGLALLCYAALAKPHGWPSLRSRFPPISRRVAVIAVVSALGLKALLIGLASVTEILGADFAEPAADPLMADRWAGLVVVAPVTILLAPLWEELFFRALLIERLRKHLPLGICVLLSSLLFALAHDNQLALGLTGLLLFSGRFAVGAVAAVLALRYRSLTPAFLCHAASNAIAELGAVLIPS